jgi:hypothetical protein
MYAAAADGLDPAEAAEGERLFRDAIEAGTKFYDGIKGVLDKYNLSGSESVTQNGLTGAIKGITEETAGLIAGQFFAFRELQQRVYEEIALKHTGILKQTMEYAGQSLETQNNHYQTAMQQLDVMNQSVTHLAAIEKNTVDIAKLNSIDDRLRDMNTYLKQIL